MNDPTNPDATPAEPPADEPKSVTDETESAAIESLLLILRIAFADLFCRDADC